MHQGKRHMHASVHPLYKVLLNSGQCHTELSMVHVKLLLVLCVI